MSQYEREVGRLLIATYETLKGTTAREGSQFFLGTIVTLQHTGAWPLPDGERLPARDLIHHIRLLTKINWWKMVEADSRIERVILELFDRRELCDEEIPDDVCVGAVVMAAESEFPAYLEAASARVAHRRLLPSNRAAAEDCESQLVPLLRDLAGERDSAMAAAAVFALGQLRLFLRHASQGIMQSVTAQFAHTSWKVRERAALTAGEFMDEEARVVANQLTDLALRDEDERVVLAALLGALRLGARFSDVALSSWDKVLQGGAVGRVAPEADSARAAREWKSGYWPKLMRLFQQIEPTLLDEFQILLHAPTGTRLSTEMRRALIRVMELPNPYARGGCARALIRFDSDRDAELVGALSRVVDDNRRVVMYSETEGEFLATALDRPSRHVRGAQTHWPAVDAAVRVDVARVVLKWDPTMRRRIMEAIENLRIHFGYDPDIDSMVSGFLGDRQGPT